MTRLWLLAALGLCWLAAGGPRASRVAGQEGDAQEREVRELIDRYFSSWSKRDLDAYGQCFMPQAAVQMIDPQGQLVTMALGPFLRSQQEAHRQAKNRLTETAEGVEVRFEAKLARVVVYWKLVDGDRTEYGYDHFTLMRTEGKWRIANVVFYVTKRG
jgi:hypothetical protein